MPKLSKKQSSVMMRPSKSRSKKNTSLNRPKRTKRKMKPVNTKQLEGTEFYCVKCKKICAGTSVNQTKMKNGRDAVRGKCKNCNTKMFRIM